MTSLRFVGNVDVEQYVLTDSDKGGDEFNSSRWKALGKAKIEIKMLPAGDFRAVITGTSQTNTDKILSTHAVHPDTCFSRVSDPNECMFWILEEKNTIAEGMKPVDTCLNVRFENDRSALDFVKAYRNAQRAMCTLYKATEHEWHRHDVQYEFNSKEEEEQIPNRLASLEKPEAQASKESSDPSNDESDSDTSVISLESLDEDEECSNRTAIPKLLRDGTDWRCEGCRTLNPDKVKICMACEVPRTKDTSTEKESEVPAFCFSTPKATESTDQSTIKASHFDFSSAGNSGSTSLQFGTASASSFGLNSNSTSFTQSGGSSIFGVAKGESQVSDQNGASFGGLFGSSSTTKSSNVFANSQTTADQVDFTLKPVQSLSGGSEFSAKKNEAKSTSSSAESKAKSAYPSMETLKKVPQEFPGTAKPVAESKAKPAIESKAKSAYPPMETLKKVPQELPGSAKPVAESKAKPAIESKAKSAYPPMETLKKVPQEIPGTAKSVAESKAKPAIKSKAKSAYPPMETMKKVPQELPGTAKPVAVSKAKPAIESKAKFANPPMETMSKVPQRLPTSTPTKNSSESVSFSSGLSFGRSSETGFGVSGGSIFGALSGKTSPSKDSGNLFGENSLLRGNSNTVFGSSSLASSASPVFGNSSDKVGALSSLNMGKISFNQIRHNSEDTDSEDEAGNEESPSFKSTFKTQSDLLAPNSATGDFPAATFGFSSFSKPTQKSESSVDSGKDVNGSAFSWSSAGPTDNAPAFGMSGFSVSSFQSNSGDLQSSSTAMKASASPSVYGKGFGDYAK